MTLNTRSVKNILPYHRKRTHNALKSTRINVFQARCHCSFRSSYVVHQCIPNRMRRFWSCTCATRM